MTALAPLPECSAFLRRLCNTCAPRRGSEQRTRCWHSRRFATPLTTADRNRRIPTVAGLRTAATDCAHRVVACRLQFRTGEQESDPESTDVF